MKTEQAVVNFYFDKQTLDKDKILQDAERLAFFTKEYEKYIEEQRKNVFEFVGHAPKYTYNLNYDCFPSYKVSLYPIFDYILPLEKEERMFVIKNIKDNTYMPKGRRAGWRKKLNNARKFNNVGQIKQYIKFRGWNKDYQIIELDLTEKARYDNVSDIKPVTASQSNMQNVQSPKNVFKHYTGERQ